MNRISLRYSVCVSVWQFIGPSDEFSWSLIGVFHYMIVTLTCFMQINLLRTAEKDITCINDVKSQSGAI